MHVVNTFSIALSQQLAPVFCCFLVCVCPPLPASLCFIRYPELGAHVLKEKKKFLGVLTPENCGIGSQSIKKDC